MIWIQKSIFTFPSLQVGHLIASLIDAGTLVPLILIITIAPGAVPVSIHKNNN
jgi:hypothetical protein